MSLRLLVVACLVSLALACSDNGQVSPPGDACRDSGDCSGDKGCAPPVSPLEWGPVCGIGCGPMMQCVDDSSCPAEAPLCLGYLEICCGPVDPLSTRCSAACTDDAACGEGWRCRADQRGCEAVPCTDGYTCPAHTECDEPNAFVVEGCSAPQGCPEGAEAHGCVRDVCERDGDCDSGGKCVWGLCYEGFGECMGPVP
jgi:hypothetical protein